MSGRASRSDGVPHDGGPGIGKSAIMEEIMRMRYRRWWWQFWKPKRPDIVWFNVADMKPTDSAGYLVPYRDDRSNLRG